MIDFYIYNPNRLRKIASTMAFLIQVVNPSPKETPPQRFYRDCTEEIKDFVVTSKILVQFEFEAWPNYFMSAGYNRKPKVFKYEHPKAFDNRICWELIDCSKGFVCIRSWHPKWKNYYLYSDGQEKSLRMPKLRMYTQELNVLQEELQLYHWKLICDQCYWDGGVAQHCKITSRSMPYNLYPSSWPWKLKLAGNIFLTLYGAITYLSRM